MADRRAQVFAPAEQVAAALLYEGYMLYPYRASSLKNRQRWNFGVVAPKAYALAAGSGDPWEMRTECLVEGPAEATIDVCVRFLQLLEPETPLPRVQRAAERSVCAWGLSLAELAARPVRQPIAHSEPAPLAGAIEVSALAIAPGLHRLAVRVANETPLESPESCGRATAIASALLSAHTLVAVAGGAFVSLLEPPGPLAEHAAACRNQGTWPVLVGPEGSRELVLSSPIILYDYPRVAPESPGDLFDATEIDEILALRILTLTEAEKAEMAASDARAEALLQRTEALGSEHMLRLHGAIRGGRGAPERPWQVGDRVRLRPKRRADVFDVVLAGMAATIEAIEQDLEGAHYLAVTIDADPGRDLGRDGQIGHRFFFRPDEVEPLGGEP